MTKAELLREGDLGILRIDNPPVNALSTELVSDIGRAFAEFEGDPSLRAMVVECAGRTFVAGGDITLFDEPDFSAVPFNRILGRIEIVPVRLTNFLEGKILKMISHINEGLSK